jgi:hypothetical protein
LLWTIGIPGTCFCGWSINVFATFYNSTCLAIFVLMWKCTKRKPWLHVIFPHTMYKPLKVIWPSLNPHIHDLMFQLCTLFDPTLDSFDVSMNVIFHPTHSFVPLHT